MISLAAIDIPTAQSGPRDMRGCCLRVFGRGAEGFGGSDGLWDAQILGRIRPRQMRSFASVETFKNVACPDELTSGPPSGAVKVLALRRAGVDGCGAQLPVGTRAGRDHHQLSAVVCLDRLGRVFASACRVQAK